MLVGKGWLNVGSAKIGFARWQRLAQGRLGKNGQRLEARAISPNDLLLGKGSLKVGSGRLRAMHPNDMLVSKGRLKVGSSRLKVGSAKIA